ncbi:Xylogalacturonan beta-1,3-xylosyltransferase [Bertholletia excelsa]
MATGSISLLLLLLLLTLSIPAQVQPKSILASLYLSPPTAFLSDYDKMVANFRIFVYPPPVSVAFTTPSESLFYTSLMNSSFVTTNPNEAHLFFVPFPSDLSTRSLTRLVRDLRANFAYWNRALGADHFFVSRAGIGYARDRNILELKKNSIQISCFPTPSGNFIPHKDITLPPITSSPLLPHAPVNGTLKFLGFVKREEKSSSSLVRELEGDPDFVVESEPSDLGRSKFCLFVYDRDTSWLGEALRAGCVPAVITDRPMQDLPLLGVLRWSEIAVFVAARGGAGRLKELLRRIEGDGYERMRELGMAAGQHLVWNPTPQRLDAFHMVMYQLWLRRHAIRYAPRDWS